MSSLVIQAPPSRSYLPSFPLLSTSPLLLLRGPSSVRTTQIFSFVINSRPPPPSAAGGRQRGRARVKNTFRAKGCGGRRLRRFPILLFLDQGPTHGVNNNGELAPRPTDRYSEQLFRFSSPRFLFAHRVCQASYYSLSALSTKPFLPFFPLLRFCTD